MTTSLLAELCDISIGRTPSRDNPAYWGGSNTWVSISDLNGSDEVSDSKEGITDLAIKECGCRLVPTGTLLFSFKLSIGKTAFAGKPLFTNEAIAALSIKDSHKLDSSYLRYYLKAMDFTPLVDRAAKGKTLNKAKLEKIRIWLPHLEEQRRIATILDKADAIRRKRRQAIDLMNDFLRSAFSEMFGEHTHLSSKISIKKLSEVCRKITDGTHQSPKFVEDGIPFLFISNIISGTIDFETKKYIDDKTYDQLTRHTKIENGDILYSTVGSYGVAVVVDTERKFSFQRHIGHIKPNTELIEPIFLCAQLNSPFVRFQADQKARGVAQKTLNLSEIRDFNILVPSREKQQTFIRLYKHHLGTLNQLKTSHSLTEELSNSLLEQFLGKSSNIGRQT